MATVPLGKRPEFRRQRDGRYAKIIAPIFKCGVLILNDLLISLFTKEEQQEYLKIVEERYYRKATLVTSQLPV